jgi:hypothetical protein
MDFPRALLPAVGMALALGGSAAAQAQPTPEHAKSLEAQIGAWLKTATGGAVALPARPVELTPEGDHYLVRVPLAPLGKVDPADAAFTAKARPLDGTRWAVDDEQFPTPVTISTTETVPNPTDDKNPIPNGTHVQPVTYRIKLGQQDAHGIFDTNFASATTSGGTFSSVDIEKEGGTAASLTHIDQATSQTTTQPVDPAHVNLLVDATATGYSTKAAMPDGSAFALEAERLHIVSGLTGVAHEQLIPLVHLVADLGRMAKPGSDTQDGPTPEEKAKLHAMLQQAHALLSGGKLDETMEGAKFDFGGNTGALAKVEMSFSGDAPADLLTAGFGLTLDGLVVDALPPALAVYVPTHFAIHPTLSNLNVAALTKMGLDATAAPAPGGKTTRPNADFGSLYAKGGIDFGFDSLALDVAGMQITGSGKFVSTSPKSVTGQAELSARGLDALILKAQSDPMLQQAVPVMIFLKGIARMSGDRAIWQVTVNNAKVMVNGVDLSALTGGLTK